MLFARKPYILAVYNHKGGVAKTTTCLNLGWLLAEELGLRVLLVDADPQCNLTQYVLQGQARTVAADAAVAAAATVAATTAVAAVEPAVHLVQSDYRAEYLSKHTLAHALEPNILEQPKDLVPIEGHSICAFPSGGCLSLLAGHPDLTEYEEKVALAFGSGALLCPNAPGAIYEVIQRACGGSGGEPTFTFVIVDLSPSIGALNRNLVMLSDGLLVPCAPDFFSCEAVRALAEKLPKWKAEKERFLAACAKEVVYKLPATFPTFLGLVVLRFSHTNLTPSKNVQYWLETLESSTRETLVPALQKAGMALPLDAYEKIGSPPFALACLGDISHLAALAQIHGRPVVALQSEHLTAWNPDIGRQDAVKQHRTLTRMTEQIQEYRTSMMSVARKVLALSAVPYKEPAQAPSGPQPAPTRKRQHGGTDDVVALRTRIEQNDAS